MLEQLRNRIARSENQGGFTLIELLVVIVIIGILLAVAVPSYLNFRGRAQDTAAQANVRAAVPAVEAYFADNSTYATMTQNLLETNYDPALRIRVISTTATSYCIADEDPAAPNYYKAGPTAQIVTTPCT
jgi:type II secretion system protein G